MAARGKFVTLSNHGINVVYLSGNSICKSGRPSVQIQASDTEDQNMVQIAGVMYLEDQDCGKESAMLRRRVVHLQGAKVSGRQGMLFHFSRCSSIQDDT